MSEDASWRLCVLRLAGGCGWCDEEGMKVACDEKGMNVSVY